ncbi:helix-turn-helix domain-containing protein [Companilactobacillus paralimentarius]|jgi:Predicted transcriptional regulators|nr:helix-turn-helix domain-containing protein [Companilactobacillus paralimentarius]KAE9564580.1 transcriptional regulator [Companilactobacillus paralimentarius]MDR4932540.1 helix-turn-helix domain-containing protein [Companilactobacillus paralimentarius]QFR69134.1 helix-turn-helix domain-containing protein [Companilactobacillus paralimentarius]
MDFGSQIKKLRTSRKMTQEQLAQKLNVSRQTISSWENNRNLPDLEMVVMIAKTFKLSLDQLILGDPTMTTKLMNDSSEVRKMRINLYVTIIMVLAGMGSFLLFKIIGSSLDGNGVLHEPFFLIPVGYLFLMMGLISGLIYLLKKLRKRN